MTRYIIAGGRDFTRAPTEDGLDYEGSCKQEWDMFWDVSLPYFTDEIGDFRQDCILVLGGARGADNAGLQLACRAGLQHEIMEADWDKHGKKAGPIRNKEMAKVSNVLIAFWDGKSKGTKNMIDTALGRGMEVHVYRYDNRWKFK